MSMTLAIDAGMASYVGAATEIVADGAGRDAARAAAIDVAAIFEGMLGRGGMFALRLSTTVTALDALQKSTSL